MRIFAAVGWVLALAGLAGVLWINQQWIVTQAELEESRAALEVTQAQREKLTALLDEVQSQQEEVTSAVAQEASQAEQLAIMKAEIAMLQAEVDAATREEEAEAEEEESTPGDGPELSDQQRQMISVQAGALAGMAYGEFFKALDVPQETKDLVRGHVEDAMAELSILDMQALRAKPPWTGLEMGAKKNAIRAQLRDSLATVLSAEQLAAWDDYDTVSSQIMYEQVVGGQLSMLAPGMSADARAMTQAVVGEELALRLDGLELSEEPYSLQAFVDAQRVALQESAARLTDSLTEDEMAELQRFIDTAEQQFAAMAQ